MKKFDVGQSIQILANIGVIAGIFFLGIEISQNNELMGYEKRLSALQLEPTGDEMYLDNPELRLAAGQNIFGREPTAEQQRQLLFYISSRKMFLTLEWQYLELPERRDRLAFQIKNIVWSENTAANWQDIKPSLDSGFVSFLEGKVGAN